MSKVLFLDIHAEPSQTVPTSPSLSSIPCQAQVSAFSIANDPVDDFEDNVIKINTQDSLEEHEHSSYSSTNKTQFTTPPKQITSKQKLPTPRHELMHPKVARRNLTRDSPNLKPHRQPSIRGRLLDFSYALQHTNVSVCSFNTNL
eukprot:TRINITY_DN10820_c0_g1_i1.p1 TRINITY_DN10820_c0_g1~~TRINITY_DN10820_c0_g1_i1.p1  ORF type:complete len:145 (+),score=26.81 TRINITY_DN10820_c0_g1_i1:139-573(+)